MPSDVIDNLFDVSGKTALVTGGTSGIGLMIARGLLDAGARVYVVSRNADPGSDATADPSRTGHWRAMRGDLSTHEGLCAIAGTFASQETRLDILVNNAGLSESEQIDVYREETWDRALDLNLKAVFFLTQKLLPLLRRAGSAENPARVINIGSGHGLRVSNFDHFGYSASKAGVHHLTRALAQRLAPENINVNAIAPGVFRSRLTKDFSKELVSQITAGIPRGRFGTDQDIVGAVIYLSSRAGAYVTSSVLSVDGGWAGIS
jgi:NAD(P)-dependent dehydrogenase (short-subunit alcohol dehydrogenase family)